MNACYAELKKFFPTKKNNIFVVLSYNEDGFINENLNGVIESFIKVPDENYFYLDNFAYEKKVKD